MAGSADITGRQNYVLGIGHPKTRTTTEAPPAVFVSDTLNGGVGLNGGNLRLEVGYSGIPVPDYPLSGGQAIAQALRLRSLTSAPTVVETAPTNKNNGGSWFIDNLAGSNAAAGNTAATAWKDAWKLPGGGAANGGTIFLAADSVWEYAASWTDYKAGRVNATDLFSTNNIGTWTSAAATPTTVRPYYPRGVTTSKPTIRWFALMQSADWTQEMGISGGKVWSAAWTKSGNSYQNTCVAFGASRSVGVAWSQQGTTGAPANLVAANQFAVDATKVYVYVPDGTNPNTYYGEVRIFGGNTQALYTSFNGLATNVRFFGIRFEMCMPAWISSSGSGASNDIVEFGWCDFIKTTPMQFRNSQVNASATEQVLSVHDCYFEDIPTNGLKAQVTTGTAGNTFSWEIYRNKVVRGGLAACYGGALFYNQSTAGTKHIAWGNYGFDCRNGNANEPIDGTFLYADVGADKSIFFGNIGEQCGKVIQANSTSGMTTIVSNLAIDCGSIGSVTNTLGDLKAPSAIIAHNTYLWTGRIPFSAIPAGPNIGGTGVKDWAYEPAFEITNSQANNAGSAYNFVSLTVVNNLAVNMTGLQLVNKKFARIPETWTTTLLVAGNATAGLATQAINGVNTGTDFTQTAKYFHLIGTVANAPQWLGYGTSGVARPTVDSPLVGLGASLSVQYQDIGGRNFAAAPTIGCYESQA